MDVTAQESGTYPASSFVGGFFNELPTDMRFTRTYYQEISPHSALDNNSTNMNFILDRLDAPYCYLLSGVNFINILAA
jgi:hypothetical protein